MRSRVYFYGDDPLRMPESLSRYAFAATRVKDDFVLDIGCGARKGPQELSLSAARVIGLDISEDAVRYCAKTWFCPKVAYVAADARALPFVDSAFDSVVAFEVIEHLKDQELFLTEAARVLRKDGILVLSTPNRDIMSPAGMPANPYHVREFTLGELRGALSSVYSAVDVFGQAPSPRVSAVGEERRKSYDRARRIPEPLRHIVPEFFRRKLFDFTSDRRLKKNLGFSAAAIGAEDFPIQKEGLEGASYFIAVCKK